MVAEVEAAKKGDNVDVSLSKLDDPVVLAKCGIHASHAYVHKNPSQVRHVCARAWVRACAHARAAACDADSGG